MHNLSTGVYVMSSNRRRERKVNGKAGTAQDYIAEG
jgi:hypothetical protein